MKEDKRPPKIDTSDRTHLEFKNVVDEAFIQKLFGLKNKPLGFLNLPPMDEQIHVSPVSDLTPIEVTSPKSESDTRPKTGNRSRSSSF